MSPTTKEVAAPKKQGKLKTFFKGVWSELKKVHWPTKKQLINYTCVVLVSVFAIALVISVFDWITSTLINLLLNIA